MTGKDKTVNGKTVAETKLLTVGSAFVNESKDGKPYIVGQMRAVPPLWDGKFLMFDVEDENTPF